MVKLKRADDPRFVLRSVRVKNGAHKGSCVRRWIIKDRKKLKRKINNCNRTKEEKARRVKRKEAEERRKKKKNEVKKSQKNK